MTLQYLFSAAPVPPGLPGQALPALDTLHHSICGRLMPLAVRLGLRSAECQAFTGIVGFTPSRERDASSLLQQRVQSQVSEVAYPE